MSATPGSKMTQELSTAGIVEENILKQAVLKHEHLLSFSSEYFVFSPDNQKYKD
jgi:hypothetical protein